MSTINAGRRRYWREHPRAQEEPDPFAEMSDTPMNRGKLRRAARSSEAARERLSRWQEGPPREEEPNVFFGPDDAA